MTPPPRTPTPVMIAAAWAILDKRKDDLGLDRLGPGVGVVEIWQAMYDAVGNLRHD